MPKASRRPATASTATGPNNRAHPGALRIITPLALNNKIAMLQADLDYVVNLMALFTQAIQDEDTDTQDWVRQTFVNWEVRRP